MSNEPETNSPKGALEFEAFDVLPVVVRRALQSTIRNWASQDARLCLEHGYTPNVLAEMIRNMDRDQAIREGGFRHNPAELG